MIIYTIKYSKNIYFPINLIERTIGQSGLNLRKE